MMNFKKTTLDNGLEVIAEINDQALSTAMGFFVRTGARDEADEIAGVSHFLEHMAFKGSDRRTAEDVNRELDEIGGVSNAFTSEEETAFYVKVLPELQQRAVDILADLLRPELRQDDFNTEKQVVLEEIKMYEDKPPFGVDEKWREYFWRGHPLSRSVLGTRESVGALTPDAMREYFNRRYAPNNIVFAASGKVDFDRLVEQMATACGDWKATDVSREKRRVSGICETRVIQREKTKFEYAIQVVDGPSLQDDDRYAATLLSIVLGDDVGSRLFWELVDTGLADVASLYSSSYVDNGCFQTSLTCLPEVFKSNLDKIRAILDEARRDGVTREEVERARNKLLAALALSEENPTSRLFGMGSEWLATGVYRSTEEELAILKRITVDDVNAILGRYSFDNPFTIAIGPLETIEA